MAIPNRDRVHAAVMSLARFIGDQDTTAAFEEQLARFDARIQLPGNDEASPSSSTPSLR
jgi:hypothetical protein